MRIPDAFGEVTGWRAWQLVGTLAVPRLQSVNAAGKVGARDAIWAPDGWFYARCPKGHTTDIPVESCTCGLYAARDREHLLKLAYGAYGAKQLKVIGEVAFAGKVIQGTQGWRAEKGRIKSLILPAEHWRYADSLGATYNVEVEVGFLFPDSTRQDVVARERRDSEKQARLAEARAEHERRMHDGDW